MPAIQSVGPTQAKVAIVGDIPTEQCLLKGEPFCGGGGFELSKMLAEAGIHRESCYLTLVCNDRVPRGRVDGVVAMKKKEVTPKHVLWNGKWVTQQVVEGAEKLKAELLLVKPNVVCAIGDLALFVLTGQWGVGNWRSSVMESTLVPGLKVIPTLNPNRLYGTWSLRPLIVHDLRRVSRHQEKSEVIRPDYSFVIRPSFAQAKEGLLDLLDAAGRQLPGYTYTPEGKLILGGDIETRAGHIACIAFSWSATQALCIPLMCQHNIMGYWTPDEETELVLLMLRVMRSSRIIGQNWNYDAQYIYRHWHFLCPDVRDTMIQQHSCFSNMEKNLAFLSSMYLEDHLYWKDDRTNWTEGPKGEGEDQYWIYNCTDAVRTWAIHFVLQSVVKSLGMQAVDDFQQALAPAVLRTMNRGIRVDNAERAAFSTMLQAEVVKRKEWMLDVLQEEVNIKSPKQMAELFYQVLQQK